MVWEGARTDLEDARVRAAAMPMPSGAADLAEVVPVRAPALSASSSSAMLLPLQEGEQEEKPKGVQHSLGRASYMLYEQPVRKVGG